MTTRVKAILVSIAAAPASAAVLGSVTSVTPPAQAYPGDPMPGCATEVFRTMCDGPVRPDSTWKRCYYFNSAP